MKVLCLILSFLLVLNGCSTTKSQFVTSLSGQSAKAASSLTVAWDNPVNYDSARYITSLQTSTDLVRWVTIAIYPYQAHPIVTITNPSSPLFFRAFNWIK